MAARRGSFSAKRGHDPVDIITDAVKKLEEVIEGSGCTDNIVVLMVNPDIVACQYEWGAVMEAAFGGRTAEFTTTEPMSAKTRVSDMFGVPLEEPRLRAAACAIVNAVSAFLCISRKHHSCKRKCHAQCRVDLAKALAGKTLYCHPKMQVLSREMGNFIMDSPERADVILLNGDGLISPEGTRFFRESSFRGKLLLAGPSTAGVAALEKTGHFCPYGRG